MCKKNRPHPMMSGFGRILVVVSLALGATQDGRAQDKSPAERGQGLAQVSSIGDSLRMAGQHPLHIVYVHGIGATGAGDSWTLQKSICAMMKGCTIPNTPVPVGRDYADHGEFAAGKEPPPLKYMGDPIWTGADDWSASAPFVDHYVLRRSDGGPVVVDEINWWPLVFPLKCRRIMPGEATLAGPEKGLLGLCSQPSLPDPDHPRRYKAFQWLDPAKAKALESIKPKAALVNRILKDDILDWRFSDAVMAVGSMHDIFREGIRQLILESVRFGADGQKTEAWEQQLAGAGGVDREFVVVSHSLGSYLIFSTLNLDRQEAAPNGAQPQSDSNETGREDAAARYFFERTSLVYFLANQLPLLGLANVTGTQAPGTAEAFRNHMQGWAELRQKFGERGGPAAMPVRPPQIVAWSDPSDLLSWCIPAEKPLLITNLYVRNTWWHWLIANPEAVHDKYDQNKKVLKIIMGTKPIPEKGQVCD
jgi:hypothetical protein